MTEPPLEDLLARLERERQQADRRYNDALTALDRAIQSTPALPPAPRPFDASRVPELNRGWDILPAGAPALGRSLKGRLRTLVWRLVGPPLESQKRFNAAVVEHINLNTGAGPAGNDEELPAAIAKLIGAVRQEFEGLAAFQSLLVQYAQTITAYVDTRDRSVGGSDLGARLALVESRLLTLKRELERHPGGAVGATDQALTASGSQAANLDSSTYVGFEDRFRGGRQEIRKRVADYVELLKGASDVVDIGCGRGELLGALKAAGISASGVDVNAGMVEVCRSENLDVEHAEALAYLERRADGSIGGLTAIQVVEHFEPPYLARLLETAYHKMRPGAPLVLETINPACWLAFFDTYIRDLTHQRPLHPDTLKYLVEASGFTGVDIQFRQAVGDSDRLGRVRIIGEAGSPLPRNVAQIADALNDHADKLNARLFSSMDYAVLARR